MTPRHWSERLSAREWGLVATALALALDQGSKIGLLYGFNFHAMRPGQAIRVLPFFNLVMMWNPGISYGLFPAHSLFGSLALGAFSAVAIIALGWWMWHSGRRILTVGLGLVVGGAIGNLIDRLIYGAVADFFHFHA
ncbi:MAG TPA: signal peptidase II, partial [Rhizomicrobium sp.]|nr:signal peptidase II [Rhizomicrobium sp.]